MCSLTFGSRNGFVEFYHIFIILLLFFFVSHLKSSCIAQLYMILIVTNSLLNGFSPFYKFPEIEF